MSSLERRGDREWEEVEVKAIIAAPVRRPVVPPRPALRVVGSPIAEDNGPNMHVHIELPPPLLSSYAGTHRGAPHVAYAYGIGAQEGGVIARSIDDWGLVGGCF